MADDKKTYILELKNNQQRKITIPADWRLTFGPMAPGSRHNTGDPFLALRIYEGSNKENQRAMFTDVRSFRDASMPIQEKRTKTKHQRAYRDGKGGQKLVDIEGRVTEWINPDEPEEPEDEFMEAIEFNEE